MIAWILLAVTAVAAALGVSLQPSVRGTTLMWGVMLGVYAALGALACVQLRKRGVLRSLVTPRSGDLSIGVLIAALGLGASWSLMHWLLPPTVEASAWVYRVLELGRGPSEIELALWLVPCAALEELVWRGWIQGVLSARLGPRRGWLVAAFCYGFAYVPSLYALREAQAGPNPLVLLTALGLGLVVGYVREKLGRLLPGAFAHATFTYFALTWLWPG